MSVPTSVTLSDLEQRNYAVQVVTDVGANREPVCDFRLVITTNWHPISYRFEVKADYCLNFGHFAFLSTFGEA